MHEDGRFTDHGAEPRRSLHEQPSRFEPGHLADVQGQPGSLGDTWLPGTAVGNPNYPRDRRHSGTPHWTEDHSEGLLPRCRTLHAQARYSLIRPEMGNDDALGPCAEEPADVGAAVSHRAVLARRASQAAAAQDQH